MVLEMVDPEILRGVNDNNRKNVGTCLSNASWGLLLAAKLGCRGSTRYPFIRR